MEITISLDPAQAAWLTDNLHETTPDKIAESLFARHIAEGGGPLPALYRDLIEWGDFMRAVECSLDDHIDLARGVAGIARAKENSQEDGERAIRAAVRTVITQDAVRRAFQEGK